MGLSVEDSCTIPKRYIMTLLGFLAACMNSVQRSSISVVIVAMVNSTSHNTPLNSSYALSECPVNMEAELATPLEYKGQRYSFTSVEQGHILGSYFYSNFITIFLGGYLAKKFGAKRVIGCSIFVSSLLDLVIPTATGYGLAPLLVVRSLQGIFGGGLFPALNVMISRWSPKMERSRIFSIIFTGISMGVTMGYAIAGWICSSEYLGGWPTVFYASGIAGICWFVFWSWLVYETPISHPTISKEELLYLPDSDGTPNIKKLAVPWRSILTSLPAWAALFGTFGAFYIFIIMLTELPTYITKVLHYDLKSSGVLSTLPNIANAIGSLVSSQIADKLRQSGKCNITTIRKVLNSISGYSAGACLIAVTFCGCNSLLIIGLVTFGMLLDGAKFSGCLVISVDMCPELAGILYGICNGIGSFSGIIGPAMVGYFLADEDTIANWSKVFYATAAVCFSSATFFLLFASAELQPWIKPETQKETKNTKIEQ